MKKLSALCLCAIAILGLFSGCSFFKQEPEIQLTPEQLARIDLILEHRDEWKEVSDEYHTYPVNEIDVSEINGEITVLHVSYVEKGAGAGMYFYHTEAYAAYDDVFKQISPLHKMTLVRVDLPNLSDEELKQVLQESYVDYLSKQ